MEFLDLCAILLLRILCFCSTFGPYSLSVTLQEDTHKVNQMNNITTSLLNFNNYYSRFLGVLKFIKIK